MLPWAALNQREFGFFGVALGRGLGLFIRTFEIDRLEPPPTRSTRRCSRCSATRGATQFSPATYVRDELRAAALLGGEADELMYRASRSRPIEAATPVRFAGNPSGSGGACSAVHSADEHICASPEGPYVCTPARQLATRANHS